MAERLESDGDIAARIAGSWSVNDAGEALILAGVRADRNALAAWCEERANAADREAETHDAQITGEHGHIVSDASHLERQHRCEGQAVAFRAVVASLRGAS